MLLPLLSSCAGSSRPSETLIKCKAPAFPEPPALNGNVCGQEICLTIEEIVQLSLYKAKVDETKSALLGCSLITWRAQ